MLEGYLDIKEEKEIEILTYNLIENIKNKDLEFFYNILFETALNSLVFFMIKRDNNFIDNDILKNEIIRILLS